MQPCLNHVLRRVARGRLRLRPAFASGGARLGLPARQQAPAFGFTSLRRSLAARRSASRRTGSSTRSCWRCARPIPSAEGGSECAARTASGNSARPVFLRRWCDPSARAADQIIKIGRRFAQQFRVGCRALLLAVNLSGSAPPGSARTRTSNSFSSSKRKRALRGGLAGGVRIVIHDNAAREAVEQLYLRLGEAGAAAGDDVCESRARHGDGVHVAFDQNREIILRMASLARSR